MRTVVAFAVPVVVAAIVAAPLLIPGRTGATEVDVVPPLVSCTSPLNGAANVDPATTELRVTFSEPMRDGSWSWVMEDAATFPELAGDPHYTDGGRTCVLPVRLEPGRKYVLLLNSGQYRNFADRAGNALAPYRWVFFTK
jgi:hypothetical protein